MYRRLPINTYSHFLGKVRDVNIPSYLRGLVYGTYVKLTHCNMAEAKESDIHKYATLGELFSRELASGVRPLDPKALIVCLIFHFISQFSSIINCIFCTIHPTVM